MIRKCAYCKAPLPPGARKKHCNTSCSNMTRANEREAKISADDQFKRAMKGRLYSDPYPAWDMKRALKRLTRTGIETGSLR